MEVLGHRGWPAPAHPENTLAAVEAALHAGAHGVEVDVRLTADGIAVCCHDADLTRVSGAPLLVHHSSYAALRAVPLPAGQHVPTFAEVAAVVAGRGRLVVDLKPEERRHVLLDQVLDALPAHDVVLSSFDDRLLDVAAELAPDVERAPILDTRRTTQSVLARAVARGDRALHLSQRLVMSDPSAVRAAAEEGLDVRVWTVNRTVDAQLLQVVGVVGVISDVPASLLRRKVRAA